VRGSFNGSDAMTDNPSESRNLSQTNNK